MMDTRKKIIEVFSDVGKYLLQETRAQSHELVNLHDVHGFYRINGSLVAHVQGYPGMSNEDSMFVSMRLRDYEKMMRIRTEDKSVSIGNEHEANLPIQSNWNLGIFMPYSSGLLVTNIDHEVKKFLRGERIK